MTSHQGVVALYRAMLFQAMACISLGTGCGESGLPGHATLVDLGGHPWHMEWSSDGQSLVVLSGVERNPPDGETPEYANYRTERVTLHRPGTWEITGQVTVEGHLADAFTCGDPNVVAVNDGGNILPGDRYQHTFSFYRMDTGAKIRGHETFGFYNRPSSERKWFPYTYECDPGTNVMYMRWASNKITALDGTSGEVLLEYLDPDEPAETDDGPGFFIQPAKDRLVWVEFTYGDSEVRIYRLSTAELIHAIPVTPESTIPRPGEYLLADQDHLVAVTGWLGETCQGIPVRVIDLVLGEITSTHCIPNRYYAGASMMGEGLGYTLLGARKPEDCGEIRSIELATGEELPPFDMCNLGWPGYSTYREIDRIFLEDTSPPDGSLARFSLLSFPELEEIAAGALDTIYDSWRLAPGKSLIVRQDYATDAFDVFDAADGHDVDRFTLCYGLQMESLRVDPSGRWASSLCTGDWRGVDSVADRPKGAGFAVVDLDHYQE